MSNTIFIPKKYIFVKQVCGNSFIYKADGIIFHINASICPASPCVSGPCPPKDWQRGREGTKDKKWHLLDR